MSPPTVESRKRTSLAIVRPAQRLAPRGTKTLILLCSALTNLGNGLDITALRRALCETRADVLVEMVDNLCDRPHEVRRAATLGVNRLVLGLCSVQSGAVGLEFHARRAGFDPLGIERVNVGGYCTRVHSRDDATTKASNLLAAAAARAGAFSGSSPTTIKPILLDDAQAISRRSLLTVPPIGYQPVAAVDAVRCVSNRGCDLCVAACPRGAMAIVGGRAVVDKHACDGCGLCVSTCPPGAIRHPTHSPPQMAAELAALLAPQAPEQEPPRAILFVCQRAAGMLDALAQQGVVYSPAWLPVELPRTGMVSATWILQCLADGAAAVGVADCGGECCAVTRKRMRDTIEFCCTLTERLDWPTNIVRHIDATNPSALESDLGEPILSSHANRETATEPLWSTEPRAAARALERLLESSAKRPSIAVPSVASPLGIVMIDARHCTLCGSCAQICPTGALNIQPCDGSTAIQFDPAACHGCGLCLGVCPESRHHTIRVQQTMDTDALAAGQVTLVADELQRCDVCGSAFASAAMVRRVTSDLEGLVNPLTLNTVRHRCSTCRGVGI